LFQTKKSREIRERILKKIATYSHLSTTKAKNEMMPVIKFLLQNLEVEKSAKIAAFYEFSKEDLEFLVGEKSKEIAEFIEAKKLHRVDETWITDLAIKEKEEEIERKEEKTLETPKGEKKEKEDEQVKKRRKKKERDDAGKSLTLEDFIS